MFSILSLRGGSGPKSFVNSVIGEIFIDRVFIIHSKNFRVDSVGVPQ
jgi:hypothetical protein